jgi:isoleucyl-tRNA synthetase
MQKQEQKAGQTNPFSEMEKDVLNFWEKGKIFEKSVERKAPKGDYVFYDGPPFATGTPHYGHIVASIMKDVVPRYWTMRGYKVERKWGWDCHGLPIENIVEKEMGSKSKKDIEKIGVEKFNELCRSKVLGYVEDWKKVITRLGRWADMDNAYKTMDLDFMESVWWVFKELYDKGLIYEGYRSMHICPRCETTLSQQEVAEGYKDIKDLSAIAKFELVDEPGTYVLAWTTTPWTLIGNVALAINPEEEYSVAELKEKNNSAFNLDVGQKIIFMNKTQIQKIIFGDELRLDEGSLKDADGFNGSREIVNYFNKENLIFDVIPLKGEDLIGKKYKPLFDYYLPAEASAKEGAKDEKLENRDNGWKIYAGDFVTTEEGTGVVHIAPAFGEDDMNLGKKENLPFIQHVGMDGVIKKEAVDFAGMNVKPIDDHMSTDIEIIKYLAHHNLLFSKEKYEHSYPHCWRCETPLINYATTSWFVSILKIKNKMLKTAKKINWSPAHIKEGRFGKWLEGARDWSISRQRFWASVIPIWRCSGETPQPPLNKGGKEEKPPLHKGGAGDFKCGNIKVFGSIKELEKLSGEKVNDLHKHIVDKIIFKCEQCGGTMKRVPDVLDTWFDSGSMPYAQMHYPFENKKMFEENFPAEFIAEGIDQTRAWFYYLHVIANGIKNTHAFKNVIVNGIVLAEDGKKMSKRLNNYPDPSFIFDQYGADALRYYLVTSPVMLAENLNFAEKGVQEALRNVVMTLWNVYKFYEMYADKSKVESRTLPAGRQESKVGGSENVLDKWILARLNQLIKETTDGMDNYNLPKAARPIEDFVNDFSTWYLRRSRERFKGDDEKDKKSALQTTGYVLLELAKVMAPFMPFMAENLWQKVSGNNFRDENKSVHLEEWPKQENKKTKKQESNILEEMEVVRKIVELGLAKRDETGIKVRQPLFELRITNYELRIEYADLIKDELNVKNIKVIKGEGELSVELNTEITPELKLEGVKRELVRFINNLRKDAGMTIKDRAEIYYETESKEIKEVFEKLGTEILKDTLSDKIINDVEDAEIKKEVKVNGEEVVLGIKKK